MSCLASSSFSSAELSAASSLSLLPGCTRSDVILSLSLSSLLFVFRSFTSLPHGSRGDKLSFHFSNRSKSSESCPLSWVRTSSDLDETHVLACDDGLLKFACISCRSVGRCSLAGRINDWRV